jgi:hypothetical protein
VFVIGFQRTGGRQMLALIGGGPEELPELTAESTYR